MKIRVTITDDARQRAQRCERCRQWTALSQVTVTVPGESRAGAATCPDCTSLHALAMMRAVLGLDSEPGPSPQRKRVSLDRSPATQAETDDAAAWWQSIDRTALDAAARHRIAELAGQTRGIPMSDADVRWQAEQIAANLCGLDVNMPADRADDAAWALRWDHVHAWSLQLAAMIRSADTATR